MRCRAYESLDAEVDFGAEVDFSSHSISAVGTVKALISVTIPASAFGLVPRAQVTMT